ncbi:sialidase family protein [Tichowtungia aerotolerans]|uniref:Exo-alpha-sialidase n=1 Tax=Tichowtungia aerotolerans TaxID=2697043 RepID=A0A6P1MBR8_9BACT|nr:sialidase family protein [Tichowtungia aerotolerans]QHI68545.1 hypothetical protein GT409_03445 [Tichowtungia aerotolerans]
MTTAAADSLHRRSTVQWDSSTLRQVTSSGGYARLIRLQGGDLLCCYQSGGKSRVRRSSDGGFTWQSDVVAAELSFGVAANPELLQLSNGDVMLMINERPSDGVHAYAISVCFSQDEGRSWGPLRRIYEAGTTFENGCWEPASVQFPDGEIQIYFANEGPYADSAEQDVSMLSSVDGGQTWSDAVTVAFRSGHRDGMPVPLLLQDGQTAVMAIEDNGNGALKPAVLRTTVDARWSEGVIDGASERRAFAVDLDLTVYAGAPYLAQLANGVTLLSVQSDEDWSADRMVVYVGNDQAGDFGNRSVPFDLPDNTAGRWNSLFVKDDQTITAVSSVIQDGVQSIWMIDGQLVTGTLTNFYADFNEASDGSATESDLNAGTAIGSWSVSALEESFVNSGVVAWDQGCYTNTAHLAAAADRSAGVTFSYDILSKRAAAVLGGKASAIRVLDEDGKTIVNLSYTATSAESRLQVWDQANTNWLVLTSDLPAAHVPATAPETLVHVEVEMMGHGFVVSVDGETLTGIMPYNNSTGSLVRDIRFYGVHEDASGAWYDNISVVQNLALDYEGAYFYADFNVPAVGAVTNAAPLDVGTEVGSWVVEDAQESLIFNGAVGFDQGKYNLTANLASNAVVKDGVVFDADIRSKRDGVTKWNGIRIKNESGQNAVSLRWTGTADGVSGSLEYWDGVWVSLGNNTLMANDFWFASGLTDHLQVQMRETDYDILLNGTILLSNAAYENSITSVGSVQFFGINDFSGAWYDSIRVLKASITEIKPVDIAVSGAATVTLSWEAEAIGTYAVQTCTNLLSGSWSNLVEGLEGVDGMLSVTTTPTAASVCYRVVGE